MAARTDEICLGNNLMTNLWSCFDMQTARWTRYQQPRFWLGGEKIGRVLVTRKEGRAPEDVTYYGLAAPDGAVAYKHTDPEEEARWIFEECEAEEIERQDPSLIRWVQE